MITNFDLYVNEMAYPSTFDMEYFKTLKTFKSRVDYCEKYLTRISSGSSRIVYKIDDEKVLKLAKNAKGVAQCEKEISLSNDYYIADLVANCFESHPDSLQVEMELARKVKKSDFQKIIGVPFEDYQRYINQYYVANIKNRRNYIDNDIIEKCEENEFITSINDYIASYGIGDIGVGDLCKLSTYGIVKRNGEDSIVMIDYGIDEYISNKYYKR